MKTSSRWIALIVLCVAELLVTHRQHDRQRGASDPGPPAVRVDIGSAVGRRRVHAGVRGPAARGRPPRRPVRPPPRAAGRHGRLRRRLASWLRSRGSLAGAHRALARSWASFAALIFPATLAIVTNMFTDADGAGGGGRHLERRRRRLGRARPGDRRLAARALQLALGVLDQRAARRAGDPRRPLRWVPESRDAACRRASTSSAPCCRSPGSSALVWSRHRGPASRLDRRRSASPASALAAAVLAVVRRAWSAASPHPLLDVALFANRALHRRRRGAISMAFFGLFGFIFLVTQYFQAVKGYSTLSAGRAHAAVRHRRSASWRRWPCASAQRLGTTLGCQRRAGADGGRASRSPPPRSSTRRTSAGSSSRWC